MHNTSSLRVTRAHAHAPLGFILSWNRAKICSASLFGPCKWHKVSRCCHRPRNWISIAPTRAGAETRHNGCEWARRTDNDPVAIVRSHNGIARVVGVWVRRMVLLRLKLINTDAERRANRGERIATTTDARWWCSFVEWNGESWPQHLTAHRRY